MGEFFQTRNIFTGETTKATQLFAHAIAISPATPEYFKKPLRLILIVQT
jgi:hypothetical protein